MEKCIAKGGLHLNSKPALKRRKEYTHKGDYGHVFILAGSRGLTGAAALCSMSCLRAGAGLVTLGIPASLNPVMEVKLTEVMTCALPETEKGSLALKSKGEILKRVVEADVVIIGPGISQNNETSKLIRGLIPLIRKSMVLDADALNAIAQDVDLLKRVKSETIVTPHPGEMARLIKRNIEFIVNNRIDIAKDFSNNYHTVVVLKGAGTVVAAPGVERAYVNKTGNPGMATAGSGDVLTGIIGAFLAQGLVSYRAAQLGVYVHGLAGDLAAKEKGEAGVIASDILEKVPQAIKSI